MIDLLKIWKNKDCHYNLKKGRFNIELTEVLFNNFIKIDILNDAYIEISLNLHEDLRREKYKITNTFESISYASTSNQDITIRYLSLNKLNLLTEKINLREIINLYIAGYI